MLSWLETGAIFMSAIVSVYAAVLRMRVTNLRDALNREHGRFVEWREFSVRLLKEINKLDSVRTDREFDKIMNANDWSD